MIRRGADGTAPPSQQLGCVRRPPSATVAAPAGRAPPAALATAPLAPAAREQSTVDWGANGRLAELHRDNEKSGPPSYNGLEPSAAVCVSGKKAPGRRAPTCDPRRAGGKTAPGRLGYQHASRVGSHAARRGATHPAADGTRCTCQEAGVWVLWTRQQWRVRLPEPTWAMSSP